MRYITARISGLLNREAAVYRRLIHELRLEREALLMRDLAGLQKNAHHLEQMLEELHDIRGDLQQEKRLLQAAQTANGVPPQRTGFRNQSVSRRTSRGLSRVFSDKEIEASERKVLALANEVRAELHFNQQVATRCRQFFQDYLRVLIGVRNRAFGAYTANKQQTGIQQPMAINREG